MKQKKNLPMVYKFCKENKFEFYILGSDWDEERNKFL